MKIPQILTLIPFVGCTAREYKLHSPHTWAVRHTYAG